MLRSLTVGLFVTLLTGAAVGADDGSALRVWIIDARQTESGRFAESLAPALPSGSTVRRSDLSGLEEPGARPWDCIVLVQPDLAVYSAWARQRLGLLIKDPQTGLFVLGLSARQESTTLLLEQLGPRSPVSGVIPLAATFAGAQWVWAPGGHDDTSTVCFRRTFVMEQEAQLAQLLITTDNAEKVWLNGRLLGRDVVWMKPTTYSLADDLRVGENVICVEATNVDGPAGMIASLKGYAQDQRVVLHVGTDASWRCHKEAATGWLGTDFDDSTWVTPAVMGPIGTLPWGKQVRHDFAPQEMVLEVVGGSHPVSAGLCGALGATVVADYLRPVVGGEVLLTAKETPVAVAGASDAGRTVLISILPEQCRFLPDRLDTLQSRTFAQFVAQGIVWAAGSSSAASLAGLPSLAEEEADLSVDAFTIEPDAETASFLPLAMQFTPLPYPHVNAVGDLPRCRTGLRAMVDDIIDHGFTSLVLPTALSPEAEEYVAAYAQSRGMRITYLSHGAELFGRDVKKATCAYSDTYAPEVEETVRQIMATLDRYPRLHNAMIYQDEPFYAGPGAFSYEKDVQEEFQRRYGYALPTGMEGLYDDPKAWLDVLNFRADYFRDGWRQVYRIVKSIKSDFNVVLTHDSHNTFGGGVGQEEQLAINDIFHWGADFADTFVFDIYPYQMWDFRHGENRTLPIPRLAQTQYAMAQMRNLTGTYGRTLGFWFGSYNSYWFNLKPEARAQYWSEREMAYTALANDADFLISGYGIPEDKRHWDYLGEGVKVLGKVGPRLKQTRKLKAKAAFLFPRAQYLQLQEEYWNVAQSFAFFLTAFGELDIIHEEQITDDGMNGYELLVLCDVKLLQEDVAGHVLSFVAKGGTVIADCVPQQDEFRQRSEAMERLFGVSGVGTDRVMAQQGMAVQDASTAAVRGTALGVDCTLTAVSPRGAQVQRGEVLLSTVDGEPALIKNSYFAGRAYLLGFCLQDTVFGLWKSDDESARAALRTLRRRITDDADVRPHAYSSNPGIEVAVRANDDYGYLVVINHESERTATQVQLADLPFRVGRIVNVADDTLVAFARDGNVVEVELPAPLGATGLYELAKADAGRHVGAQLLTAPPLLTATEKDKLLTVTMINVNNGNYVCESLLIRTPQGKTMLIDAGWPSNFSGPGWGEANYGANIIPAFLKGRGIDTIDWMMVSHIHDDHIGCMSELISSDEVTVKRLLWSPLSNERLQKSEPGYADIYVDIIAELCSSCAAKQVPMIVVQSGRPLELGGGVVCDVLAVAEPDVDVSNFINNNSIVMQLCYGSFRMMFTGDAGVEQEARVLELQRDLTSDALKIGHHAGAGSTSAAWADAIRAKVGLASMPQWLAEDPRGLRVTEQLADSNMKIYRTFQHGHIDVQSDGRRFWVLTEK